MGANDVVRGLGSRGPTKLPTAIKEARGETRSSRLNSNEPRPRDRAPRMPRDMAPEAKQVWRRIMREMADTGVIKAADQDTLRIYCEAVARYEDAARLLAESSALVRGARGGTPVRNPLHQVVRDNAQLVRLFGRELGLTPGSRAGLQGDMPEAEGDSFDDWARQSA
jgi:P27 family predicted phage terminase small subunit